MRFIRFGHKKRVLWSKKICNWNIDFFLYLFWKLRQHSPSVLDDESSNFLHCPNQIFQYKNSGDPNAPW